MTDWKAQKVKITKMYSMNDILRLIEQLGEDEAVELICEAINRLPDKCQEIIKKWMEKWTGFIPF